MFADIKVFTTLFNLNPLINLIANYSKLIANYSKLIVNCSKHNVNTDNLTDLYNNVKSLETKLINTNSIIEDTLSENSKLIHNISILEIQNKILSKNTPTSFTKSQYVDYINQRSNIVNSINQFHNILYDFITNMIQNNSHVKLKVSSIALQLYDILTLRLSPDASINTIINFGEHCITIVDHIRQMILNMKLPPESIIKLFQDNIETIHNHIDSITTITTIRQSNDVAITYYANLDKISILTEQQVKTSDIIKTSINDKALIAIEYKLAELKYTEAKCIQIQMSESATQLESYTNIVHHLKCVFIDLFKLFAELLENKINHYLAKMESHFWITIELTSKTTITNMSWYINYYNIDIVSGKVVLNKEMINKTNTATQDIINFVARICLWEIYRSPRPDFFIFDDTLNNIDHNNMRKLLALFEQIYNNPQFILVVSHMANTCNSINITHDETYRISRVNNIANNTDIITANMTNERILDIIAATFEKINIGSDDTLHRCKYCKCDIKMTANLNNMIRHINSAKHKKCIIIR
jgi:hypothetical protein